MQQVKSNYASKTPQEMPESRVAMRDQSNVIMIQSNEEPKEISFKEKKGREEESYEYEEESYYEEDAENQQNPGHSSP